MTDSKQSRSDENSFVRGRQGLVLALVILLGLSCAVVLSRWIETHRPPVDPAMEEEKLYMTGTAARRMSLGFNGLIADWYWMRALQYVGRKIINQREQMQLDNLAALDLKLLYPLLDTATTLDPQFFAVYEYGGIVLPAINEEDAIRLLKKGIANNPAEWRLYQHLGYIYWQRGDYEAASAAYSEGAKMAGAPVWMSAMGARMLAEGGSRATAREIYQRIFEQSDDRNIKRMAELRLAQIESLDMRDQIRRVLDSYHKRTGRCAASWREVASALQKEGLRLDSSGAPLDPADTPYFLVKGGCDVDADPGSVVPYK